jgi:hypothetical protein
LGAGQLAPLTSFLFYDISNNLAGGKPTMAAKKSKSPTPKNKALYAKVKAEAKRKFKVYPSAYANAWLVKTYKKRGGTYA